MSEDEGQEEGRPGLYPLVAYEAFVSNSLLCGLIVHYLESPEQLMAGEHLSAPLVMRPEMAREIAAALLDAADQADARADRNSAH